MSLRYDFTAGDFLPPGRYTVSWDEAESLLVGAPRFAGSSTRARVWQNVTDALGEFIALEDTYAKDLPCPLMHRLWLGGSFVSGKVDPRNADCTVLLHGEAVAALRGRPGAALLKKGRAHFATRYDDLCLIQMTHSPVVNVFDTRMATADDLTYFRDRGRWDDWWQRTRLGADRAPSVQSAFPRRGYLEVILDD